MVTFVILHYKNFEVTDKCIKYLLLLEKISENEIVVVDNNSGNNSMEKLKKIYHDHSNLHFIENEDNIGFAKGNNIGYLYAKKNLNSNFIVVMNNDIFIEQVKFIEILEKSFDPKYQVFGPNIINMNNERQNPFRYNFITSKTLKIAYLYNKICSLLYSIPIINELFLKFLQQLRKLIKIENEKETVNSTNQENNTVVLHGSCIIYGKDWINSNDFAFLPLTFMYFEEDLLAEYAYNNNFKMKILEELKVTHMEDASLEYSYKEEIGRRKFLTSNMAKSIKVLLKYRKNKGL